MPWKSGLVDWFDKESAYISVVFSWQAQKAYQLAIWYKMQGYNVHVGGNVRTIFPDMFKEFANGSIDALSWHNPKATFTSRGCIRSCPFCIVPKHEGKLIELDNWPIRPIICDNNILATSKTHFDNVIDKLKTQDGIDFNQGLDARLLTKHHAERLRELNTDRIRLAWDTTKIEKQYFRSWELLRSVGFPKRHIQSYVLIGFDDTPEDALYRLETIKALGSRPNPMRYQPLDSQKRNSYVHPDWTEVELRKYMKYWSRLRWYEHIPFSEFDYLSSQ